MILFINNAKIFNNTKYFYSLIGQLINVSKVLRTIAMET